MSVYIVAPSTLGKIIAALSCTPAPYNPPYVEKLFPGLDLSSPNQYVDFLFELHELNCEAVEARYQHHGPCDRVVNFKEVEVMVAELKPRLSLSPTAAWSQALKAIDCYLYQCSEGDVPERELYQKIEKLSSLIAGDLARNTKAYDDAPWG